jgi:hypothetical protein
LRDASTERERVQAFCNNPELQTIKRGTDLSGVVKEQIAREGSLR